MKIIQLKKKKTIQMSCLPCENGDIPTGIHICKICNKSVHLFGCSVKNTYSEEGFGESRICLTCAEKAKECEAVEHWQKKKKIIDYNITMRSAESYLMSHPGFDHVELNEKKVLER